MQAVCEEHHEGGPDVGVVEEGEEVEYGQEGHVEGREGGFGGVVVVLPAVDLGGHSGVSWELEFNTIFPIFIFALINY